MFERLSLEEARHVLTDFFEIHSEVPNRNAKKRAKEILQTLEEEEEEVCLGMLPTLRIANSLVSYLPDNYEPEELYLVRKEPKEDRWYSKKVKIRKKR